jgi:hypothetical protein
MAKIRKIEPVNLFIGIIYRPEVSLFEIEEMLVAKFGKIELQSREMEFDFTEYYSLEMGTGLFKKFYSFEKMIDPSFLSDVKIFTNEIEEKYEINGKRIVNLDPGYLDLPKVVLASAKDFSHRMYIGKSIFAEVTLSYVKNQYKFFPWTYSDYKTENYLKFFYEVRNLYKNKLENNHEN